MKPDQDHHKELVEELVEKNHALGHTKSGFIYKDRFITYLPLKQIIHEKREPIDPSLVDEVESLMEMENQRNKEILLLRQGLSFIIRPCKTLQDVRDSLPDAIKSILPETRNLQRTREPTWAIEGQEIQMVLHAQQYAQVSDLINVYYINRLIY